MRDGLPLERIRKGLGGLLRSLVESRDVASLGLFGSSVRQEQSEAGDLDVSATFRGAPSLLKFVEGEDLRGEIRDVKVDIAHEAGGPQSAKSALSSRDEPPALSRDEAGCHATSRRDFLRRAGHAVAGVCALSAVAGGVRFAVPAMEDGLPRRFPLGRLSDFGMNTLTWLQDRDLFVLRNDVGLGAFSCRCTHLGCTVRRTAEGFVCPCHGAEFGPLGEVISGPARRPLPWYRVWLEGDGRLWVDLGKPLESAGTRPLALVLPDEEEA